MTDAKDNLGKRVGSRLRELRRRAGFTQADLAERMEPTIETETVSRYERGTRIPSIKQLEALCEALDTDLAAFWRGEHDSVIPAGAPSELVDLVVLLGPLTPEHLRVIRRLVRAHLEGTLLPKPDYEP